MATASITDSIIPIVRPGPTPPRTGPESDVVIPFTKPYIAGRELYHIAKTVTYENVSSDGYFTQECAKLMEQRFDIQRVLMTTSCTAALEMAMMLCELDAGDEVIMPSFTFVSTASAVVRAGGRPVFVDIRPDTLNIDEEKIESAITPRTRAILPVHYGGAGAEMNEIMRLANKHGLLVVEDAAHAVNGRYRGQALGSIGHLGCYSFHETKNYICGEGGALCVNDPDLLARAEILRDKGTNRQAFFRGQTDKYTWVDVGSSFALSEILCAFLYAQLEVMDSLLEMRRRIYQSYVEHISPLEQAGYLRMPRHPAHCETNAHTFYVLLPDEETRDGLMHYLTARQIHAVFHYIPLHRSPMGLSLGGGDAHLPVTDDLSGRLLRLPFYYELSDEDIARIAHTMQDYFSLQLG
jgi:dTDP-4-amino-4,6-dideoxygalactose transaminase